MCLPHLSKSIPGHINPFTTLVVTYFTAGIACLVALLFCQRHGSALAIFKQIHWASIALGFSIIGLEAGFLLAYRAGWKISLAAGIANAIVAAFAGCYRPGFLPGAADPAEYYRHSLVFGWFAADSALAGLGEKGSGDAQRRYQGISHFNGDIF